MLPETVIHMRTMKASGNVKKDYAVGFDGAMISEYGAPVAGVAKSDAADGEYYDAAVAGEIRWKAYESIPVGKKVLSDQNGHAFIANPLSVIDSNYGDTGSNMLASGAYYTVGGSVPLEHSFGYVLASEINEEGHFVTVLARG
uniref:Uncharacterized protein n=1 Tax=Candidatus Kentrum sp. LPFa TaxID=2126335 RepID=A0A450WDD4_9GAMM|nr:MAG: hypothetical protein BECKLPF1236A_GA0070988_1012014 [Candidatus Kentron sp. LPFa]VFK30997.1 MAG: hypothetical protein BECKLPF1236C_GA0070990_1012514 [Candidatus Kentron sp. LPFa]